MTGKKLSLFILLLCFVFLISCRTDDSGVYREGRQVTYRIEFLDSQNAIQCIDTIELNVPEQSSFDLRRLATDQITNTYKYYGNCIPGAIETTGITETENRLFLHPPRLGRMKVTELGAFPKMFYPVEVGAGGDGSITIEKGFDEWNGLEIHYEDSVVKIVDTTIAGKFYEKLAFREGITENTPIGTVKTSHSFSSKYGWVSGTWKMDTASIKLYAIDYNW